ncbi:MAG: 50S ribosomal protein L20 [Rickettsiales bacterium]|nr:50S ribosomal protein L20 [Rickettsiales bacterium]|tara:strand:+ start:453 stop:800 length:348 start_codon:yes stop_codon:yes gene_type:complete
MARIKKGKTKHARHLKVIKAAKGSRGRQKNTFRAAMQRVEKNRQYAYRDRRNRKREFRKLWIVRINAACREQGIKYSEFISKLVESKIEIDRKVLANLAVSDPNAFKSLVEKVRT